ncbi:medium-chain acyl-CoA ligase ACSF2, mitochondrial-like [Ptychodera flava]|uniref:medium-chain acyl-CoA ligase ACSF2, mitochondrial-like n=1 Tax=Ptychodera flava TaxID=63121 RepID=UPI00396A37A6
MSVPRKSYLHAASSISLTGKTLCDALDQAATDFPGREAFVFALKSETQRVTFKQLRQDVVDLASGLVHLGLKPGERVGIWANNCYEWVTSFYAMAYAKLVCVRVPVGYNESYLEHLVKKTKMAALIIGPGDQEKVLLNVAPEVSDESSSLTAAELPSLKTVIHLGSDRKPGMIRFADVMKLGDHNDLRLVGKLRETVDPDDEVMLLATSGSTGLPKVVAKSHKCSLENTHVLCRHVAEIVKADMCCMSMSQFFHVGGDLSMVGGVSLGYRVIIPDSKNDAAIAVNLIQEERVTVAMLMYTHLVDFLNYWKLKKPDMTNLKCLVTGGNNIPKDMLEEVRQKLNLSIHTVLGTTETGFITINNNPEKFQKVGYPLDHYEVKIIDDKGHVVPRGTVGELCTRSPYTMLRYEGDDEQTKSTVDQSGWYHTGDMCKLEEDGCLDIMGRKKDVIIRGEVNVYPLEVDRVLVRHPAVKVSQTIGVPDVRFIEEICACVCLREGEEATADEILQFARQFLPENRVPKYILFFESLPSNRIGKFLPRQLQERAKKILGM